jgi:hypothetical protein
MKFSAYDILSSLIPGFILLAVLIHLFGNGYDADLVLIYTAFAFLLGFLVNTIGSWLEGFYNLTWGGKPSDKLLQDKHIWKVHLREAVQVRQLLEEECTKQNPTEKDLFSIACRYANSTTNQNARVREFSAQYAFARSLLTVVLISTILLLIHNFCNWKYYFLIGVLFVVWLRAKQRGYYFAKEVLTEYLTMKTKH